MKYKCTDCGLDHEDFPALAFSSPAPYNALTDAEKLTIAELTSDFCTIDYGDQTDLFVRAVLMQKLTDSCQHLEYGVWVSLSEESYQDYKEHFNNPDYQQQYFGWFCSQIPEYEDTMNLRSTVVTQKGNMRPVIQLQEENDMDNSFVKDYFKGITEQEAIRRISNMMNQINPN